MCRLDLVTIPNIIQGDVKYKCDIIVIRVTEAVVGGTVIVLEWHVEFVLVQDRGEEEPTCRKARALPGNLDA